MRLPFAFHRAFLFLPSELNFFLRRAGGSASSCISFCVPARPSSPFLHWFSYLYPSFYPSIWSVSFFKVSHLPRQSHFLPDFANPSVSKNRASEFPWIVFFPFFSDLVLRARAAPSVSISCAPEPRRFSTPPLSGPLVFLFSTTAPRRKLLNRDPGSTDRANQLTLR